MCGLSSGSEGPKLRKLGQGVLELLNGNGFETFDPGDLDLWPWKGYRPTGGQTCAKQYALSSLKGR